jgi:hypothetical protein
MWTWLKKFLNQEPTTSKADEPHRLVYKGFHETLDPEVAAAAENLVEVCNNSPYEVTRFTEDGKSLTREEKQTIIQNHWEQFNNPSGLSLATPAYTGCLSPFEPGVQLASSCTGSPLRAYICRNCGAEMIYSAMKDWYTCGRCGSTLSYEDMT